MYYHLYKINGFLHDLSPPTQTSHVLSGIHAKRRILHAFICGENWKWILISDSFLLSLPCLFNTRWVKSTLSPNTVKRVIIILSVVYKSLASEIDESINEWKLCILNLVIKFDIKIWSNIGKNIQNLDHLWIRLIFCKLWTLSQFHYSMYAYLNSQKWLYLKIC